MKRVLIIDDLQEKSVDLEVELKKQNMEVDFARCYIDAIKSLEENVYDLIILDMTLPRELRRGSELNTYSGKNILYDMLSMRLYIPSIIVTRYTYFGKEKELKKIHASNFCLENVYFMKNMEEIVETKCDISTYAGLHELFSLKIPFYVGMIYYNPNDNTWRQNLKKFIQMIKENDNEYISYGRHR